jgi:hypothetical protein
MSDPNSGLGGIFNALISPQKYPKVPAAPYVDPQQAQRRSIAGNLEALPALEQLGSNVNAYNQAQRTSALNAAIPGLSGMIAQGNQNETDWLHGRLGPTDVSAVLRGSNANAIAGGYGGSPAATNLQARDLGLTEYGVEQAATAGLPGYLGGLASILVPKPFDVTSGMVSPGQEISADQWNELYRYKQQAVQNQIDALPDPLMKAVGGFVGGLTNDIVNAAEMYGSGGAVSGIGTGGSGGAGTSSMQNLFNQNAGTGGIFDLTGG